MKPAVVALDFSRLSNERETTLSNPVDGKCDNCQVVNNDIEDMDEDRPSARRQHRRSVSKSRREGSASRRRSTSRGVPVGDEVAPTVNSSRRQHKEKKRRQRRSGE